jgi:DtxR family manganese transport transcriptional regulator
LLRSTRKNEQPKVKDISSRLESIRSVNNAITRKRTGKEDRSIRMEDYLEVIYELIQQKGYATTTDISNYLNVTLPSVTKMIRKLDEISCLDYEKYRGIRLTEEGIAVAKSIHERHSLLIEFFKMIGVDQETANRDAEGIEHHLHPETLKRLQEFVKLIKNNRGLILGK